MTRLALAVAAALLAALPARAQTPACAAASTQADMNDCAARDYQKHDAAMNDIYQRLLAKLKDPQQRAALQDAERAWIAYRDKTCAFQASGSEGGSIHPLIVTGCLDEKTNIHSAELARQLNCQEGDPSCVR